MESETDKGNKENTWDLEFLRKKIDEGSLSASEKIRLINVCNSLGRYIPIFRYHIYTINVALKSHFDNDKTSHAEKFKKIFMRSPDGDDFLEVSITCEANFIACVLTVRNIYDIFSQLINSLLLSSPLKQNRCDIFKVQDMVPEGKLKGELKTLIEMDWFSYVSGFSNTIKHRQLIKTTPRVPLNENRLEPRVDAFDYDGKRFEEFWISDALAGIVDVQNHIIACGIALNEALQRG